jgi:hypothetical protein
MKSTFLFLAIAVLFVSCRFMGGKPVRGNGNITTEQRSVGGFSGVESSGPFDIIISSGNESVKIEAEDNLLPYIETSLEGDILKVRTKSGYWLRPKRDVRIFVSGPAFHLVHLSGSGNIISQEKIHQDTDIELAINGSGDIKLNIEAPKVKARIAGSGNMILNGQTKNFEGTVSGSGDIRAMDFKTEETKVNISGSGDANVFASVKLDVEVRGSGDVKYRGGANVTSDIKGSGSVNKVD